MSRGFGGAEELGEGGRHWLTRAGGVAAEGVGDVG
jgi:hypothetical protein